MRDEVLADRLTNYADALVAAAFLTMCGLGAAIGDPDMRCELASAAAKMMIIVPVGGFGLLYALHWLTKWANTLRDTSTVSDAASRVQTRLNVSRYCLVVFFVLCATLLVMTSLSDNGCA